jgi:hypothetical protein
MNLVLTYDYCGCSDDDELLAAPHMGKLLDSHSLASLVATTTLDRSLKRKRSITPAVKLSISISLVGVASRWSALLLGVCSKKKRR